jgi:polyamine oxidase
MTSDHDKSLIIIGAGMAGIKLAHTCLQNDPERMKITILEANDYIGGRIRNVSFENYTVEMGANWISGLDTMYQNPVWKLAQEVALSGHFSDRADSRALQAKDSRGNDITKEYLESVDRFDRIYDKAVQACAERNMSPQNDISVRSLLDEFGWKESELSAVDRLVEFNILEVWIADGLERLSASHNMKEGANDVDLGKEEFFVEEPRGFNCIMASMVDDIQKTGAVIKLNCQVLEVRYAPGDVKVTARDLKSGDTIQYIADAVVSTVSLGVLQSNKIEFSPPFPEWKTKALNEIEMFLFSKVYARFPGTFWADKNQLVVCSERKGHYPFWIKYRNTDQNLFMCYLGGTEARRVEALTTEQIKDEVQELFRNAYQQEGQDSGIFRPLAVAVTDWSVNPRFCGSYSCFPYRAYADVPHEDLTRGLTGTQAREGPITLYFAGEGFDDKFNGWVQGAYRSGLRVANSILGILPVNDS